MADDLGGIIILKTADIVELLQEWGLTFSPEEINKPSTHTVQAIYEALLQVMINVRGDDLDGPRVMLLQDIEFPHYYDEGLKMAMFYNIVRKMLHGAGIDTFTLQDIARPDGLRLRKIISSFRNMLAFKNERADFMQSVLRRMDDAHQREADLEVEEAALREEYDELLRQRAIEDAKIPEAQQRNSQAKKMLNQEHKAFEQAKKDADASKKEFIQYRDRWNAVSAELQSAKQQNDRDNNRIVQSPDRLKRTIANLAQTVEQERTTMEANKAKARDLQVKLDQLAIIEQDFRLAEDLLTAIATEQDRLEQCNRDLHDVRTHHNNRQIEYSELKTKAEQIERQLANAKEKFERVQKMGHEKREASMQKMNQLREKFATVDKERTGMLAVHDALRKEIESIESEMAEYIQSNEKGLNDLMAEYWNLRHALDNYMTTLTTKFGLKLGTATASATNPISNTPGVVKKKKPKSKKVSSVA